MGLTPVPAGEIATVVTTLEMTAPPALAAPPGSTLTLEQWPAPDPARYRELFARVGTPWLWFSRLAMDESRLRTIIGDPAMIVFAALDSAGGLAGMIELDRRRLPDCELSYFGLVPEWTGRGEGRWLMHQALRHAWAPEVTRVWVHTCTLDHPRALGAYVASGFVAIGRTVETFADPRGSGLLPADAAPHIPYLAAVGSAR